MSVLIVPLAMSKVMTDQKKERVLIAMPEVVKRCGVSRGTISRLRKEGLFPTAIRLGNQERGWTRFDADEIDAWVEAREAQKKTVLVPGVPADFRDVVLAEGCEAMTTTLLVARRYGKRHDNVVRAYDNLECSEAFRLLNFEESEHFNEQRKSHRVIRMTKDGFIFLVAKFTGAQASRTFENYIACFNAMATYIAGQSNIASIQCMREVQRIEDRQTSASHHGRQLSLWGRDKPRELAKLNEMLVTLQMALPFEPRAIA